MLPSVALQLEDAKGQRRPNSRWDDLPRRDSELIITSNKCVGYGLEVKRPSATSQAAIAKESSALSKFNWSPSHEVPRAERVQTRHDDSSRADRDNWVSHRPDSRQAFAAPRPDPPSTPPACDSPMLPESAWTAPCGHCPSRRFPRLPPSSARGHQ